MQTRIRTLLEGRGRFVRTEPWTTVIVAVQLMNEHRIGSVVVMEGARLVGMFTERDVLVRVVGQDRDPISTLVEEVMSRDVTTLSPDTTVEQAMRLITEKRRRHLPVVEEGVVLGLLSLGDLTRHVTRHLEDEVKDLERYITGSY